MPLAKGEAGEIPALCPQLSADALAPVSQIPAPIGRPFPGRDQPSDVGKARGDMIRAALPSVTTRHGSEGQLRMFELPPQDPVIVVTASRTPEAEAATPASVTLIDGARIDRLGAPFVTDLLRLSPSVAVSVSGPAGSLTDVRIRGAESSHTLLFVEGIRANDPAAGNAPRFELINADLASRVEIVRGPQSALWGSEAVGGVIAVNGVAPSEGNNMIDLETGSFATRRASARTSIGSNERGVSIGFAGQRSAGIDSFAGGGELDGYRNLAARIAGQYRLADNLTVGASGFAVKALTEFDGFDPLTFARAETSDRTRNTIAAGRLFGTYGNTAATYATASVSLLGARNRNLVADAEMNRTRASRRTLGLEAGHTSGRHRFIAALEGEHERFHARDEAFGGYSNQDRSRRHQSLTLEWKMTGLGALSTDLALRHDVFSRFKDATTMRGSGLLELGGGVSLAATYGQGVAQPTFFDLYGFFPGSFGGNPSLRPETSRGGELSLRYHRGALGANMTYYRQRLHHEIVDIFDFPLSTTINAESKSRRQGIEIEANYKASEALRLSAIYAFLDASEPRGSAGTQIKELRRPKHSGSIALDGTRDRLRYGASVAYVGDHIDTDFNSFPAARVRLSSYWLANARIAYQVTDPIELHLRVANALNADYQDVLGYRTAGRSINAGVRLAFGR
jgi:vitamin B12 transporter